MNVLLIGSGGREHAMGKALKESSLIDNIFTAPGSSALSEFSTKADLDLSNFQSVAKFCQDEDVPLVCVGPEAPLVDGMADFLMSHEIDVFGPGKEGARLEGDKVFSKEFMSEFKIPTGSYKLVSNLTSLEQAMDEMDSELYVFKYRGLAGGKGVLVASSRDEIRNFAAKYGVNKNQSEVVGFLEEPLSGWELSYICIVNETSYEVCPLLQDHKRLLNEDKGPNTGGMGVAGPVAIDPKLDNAIRTQIVEPTLDGIKQRGMVYRGVVYFGLMITNDGPKVIEYNVRFGDPEAQLIFPLVNSDWGQVFFNVARGEGFALEQKSEFGACVVLAAQGYPLNPVKGAEITGLERVSSPELCHAGTKKTDDKWLVNGGRVLNVMGFGASLSDALERSYENVRNVSFEGCQYRSDIGKKLL